MTEITFDRAVRVLSIVLIVLAVFFLIDYLSAVLLPFFVAWLFAYLLYPMVKFFETRLHVRWRSLSIILTLLVVIMGIAAIIYFIIPPMIEQFQKLGSIVTGYVHQQTHNSLGALIQKWIADNQGEINKFLHSNDFSESVKEAMPKVFSFVGKTASIILSVIASMITLLYMFFILLDYEYLSENWIRIFPVKHRPFWLGVMNDVQRALNSYVRGQGCVALCMGIMFCIGFTIMDFPMAIGLGILIGLMDLVPYLHTFALIPTALLALLKAADTGQNFWVIFGMALGLFAVVQIITDFIVTPKIMGKAMGLNPAVLLLSLSVWGTLLGFIGLIIALPLTTLIFAYWQRYVTREVEQNPPIETEGSEENAAK